MLKFIQFYTWLYTYMHILIWQSFFLNYSTWLMNINVLSIHLGGRWISNHVFLFIEFFPYSFFSDSNVFWLNHIYIFFHLLPLWSICPSRQKLEEIFLSRFTIRDTIKLVDHQWSLKESQKCQKEGISLEKWNFR